MLFSVWKEQPAGYFSVSSRSKDGQWKDYFFKTQEEVKQWLVNKKLTGSDLYFCTTTFSSPKRKKDNIISSRYLWQDLDESDPNKLPPNLRPTIAWQSSPGRYQALWRLEKSYKAKDIEKLNKALAKRVKADQGSWILTKVLRIPGTKNYKYPATPTVKLLWETGKSYTYNELVKLTGQEEEKAEESFPEADEVNYSSFLKR